MAGKRQRTDPRVKRCRPDPSIEVIKGKSSRGELAVWRAEHAEDDGDTEAGDWL